MIYDRESKNILLNCFFFNSEFLVREINDISPNMLSRNLKLLHHSTFLFRINHSHNTITRQKKLINIKSRVSNIGGDWNILSNIENV